MLTLMAATRNCTLRNCVLDGTTQKLATEGQRRLLTHTNDSHYTETIISTTQKLATEIQRVPLTKTINAHCIETTRQQMS